MFSALRSKLTVPIASGDVEISQKHKDQDRITWKVNSLFLKFILALGQYVAAAHV